MSNTAMQVPLKSTAFEPLLNCFPDWAVWPTVVVLVVLLLSLPFISLLAPRRGEGCTDDWNQALEQVKRRRAALESIAANQSTTGTACATGAVAPRSADELAAIDLFVEKVQLKLTERGENHRRLGTLYGCLVFSTLILAMCFLVFTTPLAIPAGWESVVAKSLANAAVVGLFLGAAFFLGSLARSHLHEATVLFNRRHMVRLGRLYLYLKFQGLDRSELRLAKASLRVEDMERAFGSVHETTTAFKTIKAEILTNTLLGQALKVMVESVKPKS